MMMTYQQVVLCLLLLICKVESGVGVGGGGESGRNDEGSLAEIGLVGSRNPFRRGKLNENNWGGREIDRACNFIPGANGSYGLSTQDMVGMYGLPVETHTLETEDGYLLETHRIPAPGRHPVLLLYGLFMSSREMVLNCDRRALAILLADQGFDVWMINYRGSRDSRRHRSRLRSSKGNRFWSYSCDEIAKFDIPANIDYVLKLTGRRKVSWVGYSFGNSVMLALLSMRPEYNGKIHVGFMMGATVSFTNVRHRLLQYMSPYGRVLDALLQRLHHGEVSLPRFLEPFVRRMLPFLCSAEIDRGGLGLCGLSLLAADGYDPNQIDPRVIQALIGGLVNPTSSKVLAQWFQWIATGKFSRIDRGAWRNMVAYGDRSAPEYPLGRVTAPLVYFWAENDQLNTAKDVEISVKKLRSIRRVIKVSKASFNHVGFAFGKDADVYVYREIVNILDTAGESIGGMVQNSKRRLTNNLTCYQCHSETEADCLNMTKGEEEDYDKLAFPCELNETMCMVKRISFTTSTGKGANNTSPMKLVSLKRVCAAKCEPGCLIMGERIRLYFCSTCCTTSKCNVGSTGSTTTPSFYQSLAIVLVVLTPAAPLLLRLFQSNATFMTYFS